MESKKGKILLLLSIIVAIIMTFSIVNAATIKETTENDNYSTIEGESVIIGSFGMTKYSIKGENNILTANKAAVAGARDVQIYLKVNGNLDGYKEPTIYYYSYDEDFGGIWYKFENGKMNEVTDLTKLPEFNIYYVEDKPKTQIPEVAEILEESTETRKVAYTFMNDTEVVKVGTVAEGETVKVPAAPTKDHYTFKGWYYVKNGSELGSKVEPSSNITITEDTVIVAVWEINKYTITFVNDDGETVLLSDQYEYGTNLEYVDEIFDLTYLNVPEKEGDAQYGYYFVDWDKELSIVDKDETYTAVYERYDQMYRISFVNYDGLSLGYEAYLPYGAMPEFDFEVHGIPTKPETVESTYEFAGWDKEITAVTENTTYMATYTETKIKYTVTFYNYDGTEITHEELEYGDEITYTGETPTQEKNEWNVFRFIGWSPTIEGATVYGNMSFTAEFEGLDRNINADLSNVMQDKSDTFVNTYYNKYNQRYVTSDGREVVNGTWQQVENSIFDPEVFYVEIGTYPVEEVPTSITINETTYNNGFKNISIGMGSFVYLPVYKVENNKLYVAVPWLIAEALPSNSNIITVGDFTYSVQIYASPLEGDTNLVVQDVVTKNNDNNFVTFDGTTIVQKTNDSRDEVAVILGTSEYTLNNEGDVFYRLSSNGSMGVTTTEEFDGMAKFLYTPGTEYRPIITYGMYIAGWDSAGTVPEETVTNNVKIASAEYGTINLTFVMVGTNDETQYAMNEDSFAEALANEDVNTIILAKDIELENGFTVPNGRTVAVDLNGKTLTLSKTITNNGTLTFDDSTVSEYSEYGNGNIIAIAGDTITNNGVLTVNGGNYDAKQHLKGVLINNGTVRITNGRFLRSEEAGVDAGNNGGNSFFTINNLGKMVIDNGWFGNNGHYSSMIRNLGKSDDANKGILVIKNGMFEGGINTVKNDDFGTLYIENGTFTGFTQCCVQNWNKTYILGGTLDATHANSTIINTIWLDDGTDESATGTGEVFISGGNFISGTIDGIIKANTKWNYYSGLKAGKVYLLKENGVFNFFENDGVTVVDPNNICTESIVNSKQDGTGNNKDVTSVLDTTTYEEVVTVPEI